MEQETIIYFYPMKEWCGRECAAKSHWWQTAAIQTYFLDNHRRIGSEGREAGEAPKQTMSGQTAAGQPEAGSEFSVAVAPVPALYYRKAAWKEQTLAEAMENVIYRTQGMTDTFLHPALLKMMSEETGRRFWPRMETVKRLIGQQLAETFRFGKAMPKSAVVRLGNAYDTDCQMEMVWELLQPYLPWINRCVVYYEKMAEVDIKEELEVFLEEYYYEYGLVVQMEAYGDRQAVDDTHLRLETMDLCLDFRRDIPYRTARKYLDTMVKSEYDK